MSLAPAVREQILLRAALVGPPGSGKTRGALDIALAVGGKIAVWDTEHGRAKQYADRYTFDHANLHDTSPEGYIGALRDAERGDYNVCIFDSGSHEWLACLKDADKFGDWKKVTPRHNDFIEAIAASSLNVILTIRSKVKYSVDEIPDDRPNRTGMRQIVERLGVGPIQRENFEYEFDVLGYLDDTHEADWKNRCEPLLGTRSTPQDAAPIIIEWLEKGSPVEVAAEEDVSKLIALLIEEGVAESRIEAGFATARLKNAGRLHPDYVTEQTTKAEERAAKRASKGAE